MSAEKRSAPPGTKRRAPPSLWLHRLTAIFALSLGGALLLLPFPGKWLAGAANIAGALVLGSGVLGAYTAYRRIGKRPGIAIASAGFGAFCDLILLTSGIIFVAVAIDSFWVGYLERPSLLDLEPEWPYSNPITGLHFISWLVLPLALPGLTLWFTSLAYQRVNVDSEGITLLGATSATTMNWQDLDQVRLRKQRNPFSFTVVDFRDLQRVIDLQGAGRTLTINEPGSRARKGAIAQALRRHAPASKQRLVTLVDQW